MRPYITQVTGFTKDAFIPGKAYRIMLKTENAIQRSIDCDMWDDISSSRTGSMTITKLFNIMRKGIDVIFLGFEDNMTVAVFKTYEIRVALGLNLKAASPDQIRISAQDYANGDSNHVDFDIFIDKMKAVE